MAEEKKELSTTQQVAARLAGGTLTALTMAALGPVGTLVAAVAVQAYIYHEVTKDSKD